MRRKRASLPEHKQTTRKQLDTTYIQVSQQRAGEKQPDPSGIQRRQNLPRRKRVVRRPDVPDAKYKNKNVARFISKMMLDGKRSLSERIIYDAFDAIEAKQKRPPIDVFEQALKNATPTIEVKPRRVGGSTYQVPVDVRRDRGNALAMRWLIKSARNRTGRSMSEKLASELMDAAAGQGATIKKREETHKMAESNKAFAHYRW
jgi:small subunit ribosomal protein S7